MMLNLNRRSLLAEVSHDEEIFCLVVRDLC